MTSRTPAPTPEPVAQEYEMRCPQCGGDEIYAPAMCFVEVSRLDTFGNLRIFPASVREVEAAFDGELRCGQCDARFWESDLQVEAL